MLSDMIVIDWYPTECHTFSMACSFKVAALQITFNVHIHT